METIFFAVVIGIGVGVVVGALGAGGGILAVPALTYLLGQSPHAAAMGSLVIVLATALSALPQRVRTKAIRVRDGLIFGAIAMIGSVIGGRTSALVDGNVLMIMFSVMLAVMSAIMFKKGLKQRKLFNGEEELGERRGLVAIILSGLATGFLTGFFGVGGGFVVVPVLTIVLAFGMREAAGTSLIIMAMAAVAGLVSRIGFDYGVDWLVVFAFMLGSMAGGVAGGPLSNRAKPYQLTLIFAALLAAICVSSLGATLWQMLA
ncbi:MAG: sulfite exporter TauE/SafE family protein [Actinomycetaceae bacterium]|nr:sulfite exporter TauE/SafE family protein [Actinomycetaceae bacterium]